jgi:glycosyltransferase involved in cell wall biosynthesis
MTCRIVIATLLHEHGPTGVQSHFGGVTEHLHGRGLDAAVATPFLGPRWAVYPVFGVRKILDRVSGSASVWWYRYWHFVFLRHVLRGMLRRSGPVVVYAQCPVSARAALEARRDASTQRVIMVVHFNVSQAAEWAGEGRISPGGWLYTHIRSLEEDVLPRLDGIVYVSQFMQSTIEQNVPAARAVRSAVIPNFVSDLGPRQPGIITGDLITVGTLDHRKNQAYLLHVLAAAAARARRFTLNVVGDGSDRAGLGKLARQLGIEHQVQFLGYRTDARQLLARHRAYVHAARMENLSITLLEALESGLPVFAAPVGGTPEIFADNVEGVYWSLEDPDAGAVRLIEVLDDIPKYRAMQHAARARFARHFSTAAVADRLTNFLCGS